MKYNTFIPIRHLHNALFIGEHWTVANIKPGLAYLPSITLIAISISGEEKYTIHSGVILK
jgi:hypothetical protein